MRLFSTAKLALKTLLTAVSVTAVLTGCDEQPKEPRAAAEQAERQILQETVSTPEELLALFQRLSYTNESWQQGIHQVPRLIAGDITENWQHISNTIPVQQKKNIFFRLMAPLILISNENIIAERQLIQNGDRDSAEVKQIAIRYRVLKSLNDSLDENSYAELLSRVDTVPPSLALAQSAEESGWGTSRFAAEGNALFGQWDFSGKGMIPERQRKELGNYGLARFDSPLASVEGYMLNLNTTGAYQNLRDLRQQLRADKQKVTGKALATTLDKYSERGQAYIDGLQQMMSFNRLAATDEAYLSDSPEIQLITVPANAK
ncbi:hypothetical protein SIN8267_03037 [Sinobacterium norvegicum]|uniref:Mannosyl-glycoprotein endo-beta-N-acetylglucosamidase-like domain-containing protein n=1 Tax=Sinobacterium norvegicum TaxID=1641715 RepID=A0ABM9AIL6_9GAMM|nr:glucosaminidase domain-containing protein [Sinobacterium norvegicum]CAH0992899.1 hypothetical protein SIN8267_03037 [Sinobacterium norvegicum]